MKICTYSAKTYAFLSLAWWFVSCEKPTPALKPIQPSTTRQEQNPETQKPEGIALSDFKYVELPKYLGSLVPAETIKRLETEGQSMASLQDIPIHGARPIAIDLKGGVKTMVYIKNNHLVALGYLFPTPVAPEHATLETSLLAQYNSTTTESHNTLGPGFETVKIAVKKYENQTRRSLCAASYSQGPSKTLAFYDSAIVDFKKMLPSAPDTIGKEKVDQMKSEADRMKALLEQTSKKSERK